MKIIIISLLSVLLTFSAFAQEEKKNVIYTLIVWVGNEPKKFTMPSPFIADEKPKTSQNSKPSKKP